MQSSKPLYFAAALYLAIGAFHYSAGADFSAALPLPTRYDPVRDPGEDISIGLAEAKASGKKVLIEVGGGWCTWCDQMDQFLRENPDIDALREQTFVTVKVSVNQNNTYCEALARFPRIPGYPHFFVLDEKGALLQSKDTEELERGDTYDHDKFSAFIYPYSKGAQ